MSDKISQILKRIVVRIGRAFLADDPWHHHDLVGYEVDLSKGTLDLLLLFDLTFFDFSGDLFHLLAKIFQLLFM